MKNLTEKWEIKLDQIHGFLIYVYLLGKSPGHGLFCFSAFFVLLVYSNGSTAIL